MSIGGIDGSIGVSIGGIYYRSDGSIGGSIGGIDGSTGCIAYQAILEMTQHRLNVTIKFPHVQNLFPLHQNKHSADCIFIP